MKDTLKELDMDSHIAANDACVLYANYTGGSTAKVTNSGSLSTRGILFTEGGRYIRYNGITGGAGYNTLQNCVYVFGSNGTATLGAKVWNRLPFAQGAQGGASFAASLGWPWDVAVAFILYYLNPGVTTDSDGAVIIPGPAIDWTQNSEWVDSGATLTADMTAVQSTAQVSNISLFEDFAIVKIDSEIILCGPISGGHLAVPPATGVGSLPLLYGEGRGAFGSTAAIHNGTSSPAKVYLWKGTYERYRSGDFANRYRALYDSPVKLQDMVNDLSEQARFQLYQNENGNIDFHALIPPTPSESVGVLTDEANFINDQISFKKDIQNLFTRVRLYWGANKEDPGTDPDAYDFCFEDVAYNQEQRVNLNQARVKEIFGNWIVDTAVVSSYASRKLLFTQYGPRTSKFKADFKDFGYGLGQTVELASIYLTDENGNPRPTFFQIASKKFAGLGQIEVEANELPWGMRYGWIAPCNPVLKTSISTTATTIALTLNTSTGTLRTFQETEFDAPGEIRLDNEVVKYSAKSYSAPTLTLTGLTRGVLGTSTATMTATSHTSGIDALLRYYGATATAQDQYSWIGDTNNLLDSQGAGIDTDDGYYIF